MVKFTSGNRYRSTSQTHISAALFSGMRVQLPNRRGVRVNGAENSTGAAVRRYGGPCPRDAAPPARCPSCAR